MNIYNNLIGQELVEEKEFLKKRIEETSRLNNPVKLTESEYLNLEDQLDKFYEKEKYALDALKSYDNMVLESIIEKHGPEIKFGEEVLAIDIVSMSRALTRLSKSGEEIYLAELHGFKGYYFDNNEVTLTQNKRDIVIDIDISKGITSNECVENKIKTLVTRTADDTLPRMVAKRRTFRDLVYHKSMWRFKLMRQEVELTRNNITYEDLQGLLRVVKIIHSMWSKFKIQIEIANSDTFIAKMMNRLLLEYRLFKMISGPGKNKDTLTQFELSQYNEGDLVVTSFVDLDRASAKDKYDSVYDPGKMKSLKSYLIDEHSFLLAKVKSINSPKLELRMFALDGANIKIQNSIVDYDEMLKYMLFFKDEADAKEYFANTNKSIDSELLMPSVLTGMYTQILRADSVHELLHLNFKEITLPIHERDTDSTFGMINSLNWEPYKDTRKTMGM